MDNMKICCVKLSLAARVIAMIGLITSVLILTQLSTELADPENAGGSVSILLGLDVEEFKYTISGEERFRKSEAPEIMVAFLLFSFIYAVASAILIWGTIVEQSWCALPWLICEAFSFATQVSTLAIHAIALRTRKDKWIITFSVLNIETFLFCYLPLAGTFCILLRMYVSFRKNLVHLQLSSADGLTVYFWIVVFCAQRTWRRQSEEEKELERTRNGAQDKSEESPVPPLPNKYMQV